MLRLAIERVSQIRKARTRTHISPRRGSYNADTEVAAHESPPFGEYAKLILKVSHNYGANLDVCLTAVKAGSTDCNGGH